MAAPAISLEVGPPPARERAETHDVPPADPFGLDPELRQRVLPAVRFLHDRYWRVDVAGIQHVPARGPVLLVANHSGAVPFDGAMIGVLVPLVTVPVTVTSQPVESEALCCACTFLTAAVTLPAGQTTWVVGGAAGSGGTAKSGTAVLTVSSGPVAPGAAAGGGPGAVGLGGGVPVTSVRAPVVAVVLVVAIYGCHI